MVFAITRHQRVIDYIENLEKRISLKDKKDKEVIREINKLIRSRVKDLRFLNFLGLIFFIGIYFSFVSFFFSDIAIIGKVTLLIGQIVGLVGTTGFVIGLYFVNKFKELRYQDLTLLTSHLISVYTKSGFIDDEEEMNGERNMYKIFLDFFKKRGFDK